MAAYVERLDLTEQQRKGLKFFANNPPGPEVAGPGPFATGQEFATAALRLLGDKGFAARDAAKNAKRAEIYAASPDPTQKAAIEAAVVAAFPNEE